jgi:hypothetical protein
MSSLTFFVPEFAKVNKGKLWFHRLHRDGLREVARDKDELSGSGIQGCDEFRRLGYPGVTFPAPGPCDFQSGFRAI